MQTPATAFPPEADDFNTAQVGAIAHLYRGEVYRSTMWRTRLDNTTNWAVVTTGIALSLTFSGLPGCFCILIPAVHSDFRI